MTSSSHYFKNSESYPSLKERVAKLTEDTSLAHRVSATEFILEGLAIGGKIKKEVEETSTTYGSKS